MSNGIKVKLTLAHTRLAAGGPLRVYGTVHFAAPHYVPENRPPLDLVACIDASGSMQGQKLLEARQSVKHLVSNLGPDDRLGLVAFSSVPTLLEAPVEVSIPGRDRLGAAIDRLDAEGNTNMGGGVASALALLQGPARTVAGRDAIRRVLVFTDGHANAGLVEGNRAGWAKLLRDKAEGTSASWFGFGEDHDALFLSWLADHSRGNAYVARDSDAIGSAFAQELGGLLGTVATDLRIRLHAPAGPVDVLNDERMDRRGDAVVVELPSLSSDERRDVVFEIPLRAGAIGEDVRALEVDASWLDTRTGARDSVTLSAAVRFVDAGQEDAPNGDTLDAVVQQRAANAQKEAARLAELGDHARAAEVLVAASKFAAQVGTPRAVRFAEQLARLVDGYSDRETYQSSRSNFTSLRRSHSKSRPSGSDDDAEYLTGVQKEMLMRFGKVVPAAPAAAPNATPAPTSKRSRKKP